MSAAVIPIVTQDALFGELRSAAARRDAFEMERILTNWAELFPETFDDVALAYAEDHYLGQLHAEAIEVARSDFETFVRVLKPEFELEWFHERLCQEIQAWATAAKPYGLVLELPPGHAKSTYAKMAMAWLFGVDPDYRAAYTSYSQDLADTHSAEIQQIMLSAEYGEIFPETRLNERRVVTDESKGARRTKDLFEVVGHTGKFKAVGVGGSLTGHRCDAIMIDDPVKDAKDARSLAIRDTAWLWYSRVAKTRKRPGRPLRFLLLLTRWHLDDLAGRVLAREHGDWKEVRFPALKEGPPTEHDPREEGEALWNEVADAEELEKIKAVDPEGFQALYQGRPVPEGGSIFKLTWFERRWGVLPELDGLWLQSWDFKHGGQGEGSSYVVGQLWFRPHGTALAFLVDQVRGRWSTDESLQWFDHVQNRPRWARSTVRLIEKKGDGVTILSLRASKYAGMTEVVPRTDKETRARGVTPLCRAGNVMLPEDEHAVWVLELIAELTTFPAAPNDDQVDAFSQALDYLFVEPDEEQAAQAAFDAIMGY